MVTVSGSYSPESNIFARPLYHCKSVEVKYVVMFDVAELNAVKDSARYTSSAVENSWSGASVSSLRGALIFLGGAKVLYLLFHTLAQL